MDEKQFSKEQYNISRKNHRKAWIYFYPEGKGKAKEGYCLHHKDPNLDIEKYIQWNIEDLEMLTLKEHNLVHKKHLLMRKNSDIAHKGSHHYYNPVTGEKIMSKENPGEEWKKGLYVDAQDVENIIGKNNGMYMKSVYDNKTKSELTKIKKKKQKTFYAKSQEERDLINGRRGGGFPVICLNTRRDF